MLGRCGGGLEVESWVMSCRAFSRRIEHACLARVFARFDAPSVRLDFAATERNGPLQSFLGEITGEPPSGPLVVERARFEASCPPLPHRIEEVA
jgi:predicted enzyme involved in methoxymalonyl-ACP biosynthesis